MKLFNLIKLQKEFIQARDNPLVDEDEYIYLDNKIIMLQKKIDTESIGIVSITFLFFSMFFGILGIFIYAFVFFSIFLFIMGIIIGGYALYLTTK